MKKILLIEDDADLFSLIQYNLEKEGFQFAGSQTGKGAVELCRREKPDLVILDIMLPDSDGLDICKRIRAHPELSHLPIIVDPSHGVGIRDKIAPMARAGIAAGADGLIIEVHHDPDHALSDGPQSLYPSQFDELVAQIRTIAGVVGRRV